MLNLYWMRAKVIFITGGSASGKTTLANQMKTSFGKDALLISQDVFYKPSGTSDTNFDIPSAFDFDLQRKVLLNLINLQDDNVPIYDYSLHDRVGEKKIKAAPILIFEGLFTFFDKNLLDLADLKIFVDTPADTRLGRRIMRDVVERGRDVKEVISRWTKDVQPSYRQYISHEKQFADMIIPWTVINIRATDFLVSTITNLKHVKR